MRAHGRAHAQAGFTPESNRRRARSGRILVLAVYARWRPRRRRVGIEGRGVGRIARAVPAAPDMRRKRWDASSKVELEFEQDDAGLRALAANVRLLCSKARLDVMAFESGHRIEGLQCACVQCNAGLTSLQARFTYLSPRRHGPRPKRRRDRCPTCTKTIKMIT